MKSAKLFVALSVALIVSVHVRAQVGTNFGYQTFQAYHVSDFDSVNLANGNLVVDIPVVSYPQRGHMRDLKLRLTYNNIPWAAIETGPYHYEWAPYGNCCATPNIGVVSGGGGGWPYPNPIGPGEFCQQYGYGSQSCSVSEPAGDVHALWPVYWNTSWPVTGTSRTIDGSGFYIPGLGTGGAIVDRDGTTWVKSGSATDSTGNNTITAAYNYQGAFLSGWTDSVGRQIPALPGGAALALPWTPGCYTAYYPSYPASSNTTVPITLCYSTVTLQTNFGVSGVSEYSGPAVAITSLTFPNGRSWTFSYDSYGDLVTVTLPTGGQVSYTWQNANNNAYVGRVVTSRALNPKPSDPLQAKYWTYSYSYKQGCANGAGARNIAQTTTVTDQDGNSTAHTFGLFDSTSACPQPYETQAQYKNSSSALLKTVTKTYFDSVVQTTSNVVIPKLETTTWPSGKVSQVCTIYDNNVNTSCNATGDAFYAQGTPNDWGWAWGAWWSPLFYGSVLYKYEWDYGNGAPGSLLRQTRYQYQWQSNSSYLTANVLDAPSSTVILDGSGNQIAKTTYGYDEPLSGTNQFSGAGYSNYTSCTPGPCGNQTSDNRWLNTTSSNVTTHAIYNSQGMPTLSIDAKGNQSQITYDATGVFPSQVQYPTTGGVTHSEQYAYDANTGLRISSTDQNGQVTSNTYDSMRRLTSASYPDGGSETYSYNDSATTNGAPTPTFTFTKAVTSSPSATNYVQVGVADGLGRPIQTQLTSDPEGTDRTDTTYDNLGRKYTVSNPYRSTGDSTYGIMQTTYDPLNRVTLVTEADGSTIQTDYSQFPCATVTDGAGKNRKSCADSLGRITSVWEDPTVLNYETDYTYDALDNLRSATQKGSNPSNARVRTFTYDSLSRLVCAANPEVQAVTCPASATSAFPAGAITYTYDANGNLVSKVSPQQNQPIPSTTTTVSYCYDALNRMTSKAYTAQSCPQSSPAATYSYDQGTYGKPRRTGMTDAQGNSAWTYDRMGRTASETRVTSSVSKTTSYTYNLDGSTSSITYPSNRTVNYTYFPSGSSISAGRVISVADSTGPINYVTSATYAPPGEPKGYINGFVQGGFAGITTTNSYNSRLQPVVLSAASPSATVLSLSYDFHAASHTDNGNIYQIVNNRDTNRTQNFSYDSLNRIQQAWSSGTIWGETFGPQTAPGGTPSSSGIDAWGNLWQRSPVTGKTYYEGLNLSVLSNNQLSGGFGYDAAGNMTSNNGATYNYDPENRITAFNSGNVYGYDADGRRVMKNAGAVTLYWYDAHGNVLDETTGTGALVSEYIYFNGKRVARRDASNNVHYYFSDHLGSASVVTDAVGTMSPCPAGNSPMNYTTIPTGEEESDYYPYGGEMKLCDRSPQNYKFTGKERDSESQLDYFQTRHYSPGMGRFLVPDVHAPLLTNPQTLNQYAYVANNPILMVDPDGRFMTPCHIEWSANALSADLGITGIGSFVGSENRYIDLFFVGHGFDDALHAMEGPVAYSFARSYLVDQASNPTFPGNASNSIVALVMAMHLVQDEVAHRGITSMAQHIAKYGLGDDENKADMREAQDATHKLLSEFHSLLVAHLGKKGAQDALLNMAAAASDLSGRALRKYIDDLALRLNAIVDNANAWQRGYNALLPGEPSGLTSRDEFSGMNQLLDTATAGPW